ncbi:MAG: hypothetical protein A2508_09905 [Candidatus Lambdaproteobacteria bacterium RIFOXYD12_FULL_49_8]|nr:MAG: hypothetical protein A2508_09905 [Candidatus Lambdaproteobacteria bacterium RIFOXYD12_FULL_49_8]
MKNLRFLLAINTRWWNAEAHYALNLGLALRTFGHESVFLINLGSPICKRAIEQGFEVITDLELDNSKPWVQWNNYQRLLRHLQAGGFNHLVSFKSAGSWIFGPARRQFIGMKHIKIRGEARAPRRNWLNRLAYGPVGCDGVLGVSRLVQGWIEGLGIKDQPVGHLFYGAPELVDCGEAVLLNLPRGKKICCLLGRNQPVKGHLECLEAFRLLNREDLHLLFLIKDLAEFPEQLKAIEAYIKTWGMAGQVTLKGPVANLAGVLAQVDLGLIPSLGSEVNCRVMVEFLSQQIPVVVSPAGTLPELVKNQAVLAKDFSALAFKTAMEQALNHLEELRANTRIDYLERFSLNPFGQGFLDFLAQIEQR